MLRRSLAVVAAVGLLTVSCQKKQPAALSISPEAGPSGSTVTLTFAGLEANDPITIFQSNVVGSSTASADENGNATVTEMVQGEPGTSVTISGVVGATGGEDTLTVAFTISE